MGLVALAQSLAFVAFTDGEGTIVFNREALVVFNVTGFIQMHDVVVVLAGLNVDFFFVFLVVKAQFVEFLARRFNAALGTGITGALIVLIVQRAHHHRSRRRGSGDCWTSSRAPADS